MTHFYSSMATAEVSGDSGGTSSQGLATAVLLPKLQILFQAEHGAWG